MEAHTFQEGYKIVCSVALEYWELTIIWSLEQRYNKQGLHHGQTLQDSGAVEMGVERYHWVSGGKGSKIEGTVWGWESYLMLKTQKQSPDAAATAAA